MANFSPVDRDEIQKNQTKIVWWTLVTLLIKLIRILLKWKYLCHFSHHVVEREAFCIKKVSPQIPVLEYSYGKIFIPVAKISVAKTENLVTGVARLLVWTCRKFLRRKELGSESLKPSQSGWPGSYEEALSRQGYSAVLKKVASIYKAVYNYPCKKRKEHEEKIVSV